MRVLLDTNVLARLADTDAPQHADARRAVAALEAGGHEMFLVPQVLYEFWAVATRGAGGQVNGLGMSADEAERHVRAFRDAFPTLEDERGVFDVWFDFVLARGVRSRKSYDVRLAASCVTLGLSHVLTFNVRDFRGFAGVDALDPAQVTG